MSDTNRYDAYRDIQTIQRSPAQGEGELLQEVDSVNDLMSESCPAEELSNNICRLYL